MWDWDDLAAPVSDLLRVIVADDHDAAVRRVNSWLLEHQTVPFIERQDDSWALHFHSPQATFTHGWSGGIAAALAVSYSTGDAFRIGSCAATACTPGCS